MAIQMSSATVSTENRENLMKAAIDVSATTNIFDDAKEDVGITEEFATEVTRAIDDYIAIVENDVKAIENASSDEAFKGTSISAALSNFVTGIKKAAEDYITRLQTAENEIINNVNKAYEAQDTELASNVTSDASSLTEANNFGFSSN